MHFESSAPCSGVRLRAPRPLPPRWGCSVMSHRCGPGHPSILTTPPLVTADWQPKGRQLLFLFSPRKLRPNFATNCFSLLLILPEYIMFTSKIYPVFFFGSRTTFPSMFWHSFLSLDFHDISWFMIPDIYHAFFSFHFIILKSSTPSLNSSVLQG